jgi:hypothetical protein
MQIGAGYDIPLSTDANKTQFVLSPFSLSTLFWSKSTLNRNMEQYDCRAGVALKFGQGKTFKKLLILKQTNKFRFQILLVMFLEIVNLLRYFQRNILTMDQVKYLTVMFY